MTILHIVSAILGVALIVGVLVSALETVVLPRRGFTRISRVVFAVVHRILIHRWGSPGRRDSLRGLFAPVALVSLPLVWMLSNTVAFTFVFWGIDTGTFSHAFVTSGSSLFTLGFAEPHGTGRIWLTFVEATVGLGLVALLISYLPTIYSAYNEREKGITVLRPFAGSPSSSVQLLASLHPFGVLETSSVWTRASDWVIDLDQSHTSFPALSYFPSRAPGQSWVASFGTVLDCAAILLSAAGAPESLSMTGPLLTLAYGVPAIGRIGLAAGLPLGPPSLLADLVSRPDVDPPGISVTRAEFEQACERLGRSGTLPVPVAEDAWPRFATIRSGYDRALRGLAGLSAANPAPWTTDRAATVGRPRLVGRTPLNVDWTVPPPGRPEAPAP